MSKEEFASLVIDLDGAPLMPKEWRGKGWQILPEDQLPNVVTGRVDLKNIVLYLSKKQEGNGKVISCNELLAELKTQPVLNDRLLDWLLGNQHWIPESWRNKEVYFWGTIYRDPAGCLHVRFLCEEGDGWGWGNTWLVGVLHSAHPAAVSGERCALDLSLCQHLDP